MTNVYIHTVVIFMQWLRISNVYACCRISEAKKLEVKAKEVVLQFVQFVSTFLDPNMSHLLIRRGLEL